MARTSAILSRTTRCGAWTGTTNGRHGTTSSSSGAQGKGRESAETTDCGFIRGLGDVACSQGAAELDSRLSPPLRHDAPGDSRRDMGIE
jgi:hypothetical protein